jgi:hypothetical protein
VLFRDFGSLSQSAELAAEKRRLDMAKRRFFLSLISSFSDPSHFQRNKHFPFLDLHERISKLNCRKTHRGHG